ncbi:MAG: KUP/HAK/KT family potassium transporter [Bacteroidia bacterium]|nr:KUP/HAK/KT family potassium transporter [Bacteroidia bacterium]
MSEHSAHNHKVTAGTLLVTLGIIYGDIGTSPLYVMKSIVDKEPIDSVLVLGGLSCVFWTITLLTTIKYVFITLNADNKGEGGIFSLYALLRRMKVKWLIFPAILGGCTLLADGIITPPISVTSAVEGLGGDIPTIPIVIAILTALFMIQQFGTKIVGKFFGPVMFVWFAMLAFWGVVSLSQDLSVLRALNPYYAWDMLAHHKGGFYLLGAVFLCSTGAEALYSDLGHCGKQNVRLSWGFVKVALLLNYFGQGAYLLRHTGQTLSTMDLHVDPSDPTKMIFEPNPFFAMIPEWFRLPAVIIATLAAIVASQALISGSFTLINEAIRLNFWPKVKIRYPSDLKGQIFVPSVNWLLWAGCVAVVLYFQESSKMEAAYGLAIVLTMLMTTTLLAFYMRRKHYPLPLIVLIVLFFLALEGSFLAANLNKFSHGGFVTIIVAAVLFAVMIIWYYGKRVASQFTESEPIDKYKDTLINLSNDETVPRYATNLVFMTNVGQPDMIESKVFYSIVKRLPKRADIYWFLHVHVVDEPYRMDYDVTIIADNDIVRVDFYLGFRVEPRINLFFRKVVENMVKEGEVDIRSKYASLSDNKLVGDFRFVLIEKYLSGDNDLALLPRLALQGYFLLKKLSLTAEKAYGLETSSVFIEKFPLIVKPVENINLKRMRHKNKDAGAVTEVQEGH